MNIRGAHPIEAPDYQLVRRIGASAVASLYLATELSSRRTVAVKIFHHLDAGLIEGLERQLQLNAQLAHPNIVRVDGTGHTSDGRLFYSMPLLVGFERMLPRLLGKSPRIAALLRELLAGLDHAHQLGVVHGGIKPSNVLFDEHGRARLADFGIARRLAESAMSRADAIPMQAHAQPPDPRADLYAIGKLAHALLSGAAPLRNRVTDAPTVQPVPRLTPGAAAWQAWIDRALAESPEQRFQSAREMAAALSAPIVGGFRAYVDGVRTPRFPRVRKWKLRTALPLAALVALVGWAAWEYQSGPAIPPDYIPAATSIGSPALPPATSRLSSTPAPAGTALLQATDRVQNLIATAATLQAKGQVFSPPFHNAASQYLAALSLDPGNPAATAGIGSSLAALRDRLDKAWRDDRKPGEAVGLLRQGDALAEHAAAPARQAWLSDRSQLAQQVGDAIERAARRHDASKIKALAPLAKALPAKFPAGFDLAAAERAANTRVVAAPMAGTRMRDPHGPLLVYVPAVGKLPAFAIERVEVTRADYAVFARATHRPAPRCLAAHNPFSRFRHLTWRAPGFAQAGDHPAVCVSWDDAAAYAAWLSKTTREDYRLPSSAEWRRAARGMPERDNPCQLGNVDDVSRRSRFDDDRWSCNDGAAYTAPVGHYASSSVGAYDMYGNVSEWLAGGSAGARAFRGRSWRDGSHVSVLDNIGSADSDVGYTSVGFRVVRVIDARHPLPRSVAGH
ncbi:MAG: hypothetical protein EPN36_10710 [Rhodanobacteraceae bacterium]|nr:MAG: hypothetical protein EPN36_10710 [Rhodanobacteraceae bacterium]